MATRRPSPKSRPVVSNPTPFTGSAAKNKDHAIRQALAASKLGGTPVYIVQMPRETGPVYGYTNVRPAFDLWHVTVTAAGDVYSNTWEGRPL